ANPTDRRGRPRCPAEPTSPKCPCGGAPPGPPLAPPPTPVPLGVVMKFHHLDASAKRAEHLTHQLFGYRSRPQPRDHLIKAGRAGSVEGGEVEIERPHAIVHCLPFGRQRGEPGSHPCRGGTEG